MISARHAGGCASRLACGLAAAALASGGMASAAAGAKLSVLVPAKVKKGKDYSIGIDGTFTRREVRKRAYLVSIIQFAGRRCQASAQSENAWANRTRVQLQFYFAPNSDPSQGPVGIFETSSPFTQIDSFTAGLTGRRHVCVYLYTQSIKPGSSLAPIARADASYRVVR
jgi:hypothetical protein